MTTRTAKSTVSDTTDGLASAYQTTQITGAGVSTLDATGGLSIPVTVFPSWRVLPVVDEPDKEQQFERVGSHHADLATKMTQDAFFRELVARGQTELGQGRRSRLEDVKRRLGDI